MIRYVSKFGNEKYHAFIQNHGIRGIYFFQYPNPDSVNSPFCLFIKLYSVSLENDLFLFLMPGNMKSNLPLVLSLLKNKHEYNTELGMT